MLKKILVISILLSLGSCGVVEEWTGGAALTPQDSQALGASCRQTGRSLEECFKRNPKADKANIYIGWKEMNEYMAANNLKTLEPLPDGPTEAELKAAAAKAEKAKAEEEAKRRAALEPDLSNDPEVKSILNSLDEIQRTRPLPGQREADRLLKLIQESAAPDRVGEVHENANTPTSSSPASATSPSPQSSAPQPSSSEEGHDQGSIPPINQEH